MYHPDAMMKIAHTREAELVREAQRCGVPQKADARGPSLSRRMFTLGLWLAVLATALMFWAG
ncbi:MAG: hypothetical protein ACRDH2_17755 [Anaerolineales bacterium]